MKSRKIFSWFRKIETGGRSDFIPDFPDWESGRMSLRGGEGMDNKMNSSPKNESYSLIPEKELKCVWMTAGLLSYKLCKYDLQCEKCPLDWELRNLSHTSPSHPAEPKEVKKINSGAPHPSASQKVDEIREGFLGEDPSLFQIKESLFYHRGHTWIKVEKADEVRVGLDHFLGALLGKVNVIVLPLSGRRGVQGETLCSLIQEEGILHIVFPISGLILSVNPKLKDHPELISQDPLGDGYLLTLKPKNLQRDEKQLFSGEVAFSWYQREWERFKEAIVSELHHGQERLGMTMQDGGIQLSDAKRIIGPQRYIPLVSAFLRKGEDHFSKNKYKRDVHTKFQLG